MIFFFIFYVPPKAYFLVPPLHMEDSWVGPMDQLKEVLAYTRNFRTLECSYRTFAKSLGMSCVQGGCGIFNFSENNECKCIHMQASLEQNQPIYLIAEIKGAS